MYDFIQKLRLDKLTWKLLEENSSLRNIKHRYFQVKPTQVYLVIKMTNYASLHLKSNMSIPFLMKSTKNMALVTTGTLYCSNGEGGN
jgi:hypothetical protein